MLSSLIYRSEPAPPAQPHGLMTSRSGWSCEGHALAWDLAARTVADVSAPGWYPDPAGAAGVLRFFDGQGWTARTREHPAAPPAPAAQPQAPQPAVQAPPAQAPPVQASQPQSPAARPQPRSLAPQQATPAPSPHAVQPRQALQSQPPASQPPAPQPPLQRAAQPQVLPTRPSLAAQGLPQPGAGSFAPAPVPGTAPPFEPRPIIQSQQPYPSQPSQPGPYAPQQAASYPAPAPQSAEPRGFFLASDGVAGAVPEVDPFAAYLAAQRAAGISTDGPRSPAEGYGLDEAPEESLSFRALLGHSAPAPRVGGSCELPRRGAPSWVRKIVSSLASLVMLVSVAGAGWIGWDLYGSSYYARSQQAEVQYSLGLGTSAQGLPGETLTQAPGAPAASPAPAKPGAKPPAPAQPAKVQLAPPPQPGSPVAPVPAGRAAQPGEVVGRITIPAIGVDQAVFMGTDVPTLKRGPGIWRDGVLPGFPGNATVSGHRTTHGAVFRRINELKPGDRITVSIPGQELAVYEVRAQFVVSPKQVSVTYQTPGARLTITTCDPVGSAAKRRVIQAELVKGKYASHALPKERWAVQK